MQHCKQEIAKLQRFVKFIVVYFFTTKLVLNWAVVSKHYILVLLYNSIIFSNINIGLI